MPMTAKGRKIMGSMMKQYGPEKGKRVFYASENAGRIKGVAKGRKSPGYGYTDDSNSRLMRMPRNYRVGRMERGKVR